MRKACVIGYPVSHSLSPRLHNYWLKQYGIAGEYSAMEVEARNLRFVIKDLAGNGFVGCNITIPHKESVIPFLTQIDEKALAIGAVNTVVVRKDGSLHGTNTDAYGFIQNLKSHTPLAKKDKAVVLGAGGAAKAVVKALADEGFAQIIVTNRTLEKINVLRHQFGKNVHAEEWEFRDAALEGADLLVNTTSLGLKGKEPLDIDLAALPKHAIVNDIVYTPLMTPFLELAEKNGNPIVDGLGMLIWQALPAFEAWFGTRPEVTPDVRKHLLGNA